MDKGELEKQIDEILSRGVENIYPSKEALKSVLMSGKKIRLYCGYDPTAKTLHIGNAISINKLGQFQKLGHEVVFLVGDFTGMIGDPTDKTSTRKKLTRSEVLENAKNYQEQASKYLRFDGENPAIIKYNSEWHDKLTFKDLIELASNFTLQQMINRKMFKRELTIVRCRHCGFEWMSPIQFGDKKTFDSSTLNGNVTNCPNCGKMTGLDKEDIVMKEVDQLRETPIGFHELLYPLAQGYDSVAMDVDLEIGGNDQMFNMMCGRDLLRATKSKEKFVLTMKILADENGKKMGKTEGNVVNLDETPENMFGQVMSWSDGLIFPALELCTDISEKEIANFKSEMESDNLNPRDIKLRLAGEIVKINHGEELARIAREYFINTFSKKEIPTDIAELELTILGEMKLVAAVFMSGNAASTSEAKRKIEQGGVSIDDEKLLDPQLIISKEFDGKVLKIGKMGFVKIVFEK